MASRYLEPAIERRSRAAMARWQAARLGPDAGIDYWRQWFLPWDALPGRHELTVRATDLEGEVQPEGRTPDLKGRGHG